MEYQDNIALSLSNNITDTQLVEFLNTEIGDTFMVALHCVQSPAQECFVPMNYDQSVAEANLDSDMSRLINEGKVVVIEDTRTSDVEKKKAERRG
ncbi:hypothetical protein GDO81_024972 [Engystomops pustulosus]|uniref:Uncharacterized protein n=1 Tax=Engystomops pustulosus TaxID=76066 RepID=A0AAV6Z7J1_ENGPU|nr:hypothetical protein GDO81_024972 [Engystomops pustulosus]KAG8543306.1 hypothetical protein GDO81_024972 [Engystomops pustulosus]KAG8543307.1 hypothetical protein GDO81_024972 [Engystomops pustulosus]